MLDQWEDASDIVPRSYLDEIDEIIYFFDGLTALQHNIPEIINEWQNQIDNKLMKELQSLLKTAQTNMQEYTKRKAKEKKEIAQRRQQLEKAIILHDQQNQQ